MNTAATSLQGLRVVVTRPLTQGETLAAALNEKGAQPILIPSIKVSFDEHEAELIAALREATSFDWVVFTSANGVEAAMRAIENGGIPRDALSSRKLAVIGAPTARALSEALRPPDAVPDRFITDAVPDALGDVRGKKILLARADIAEKRLPAELRARGAEVTETVAYAVVDNVNPELITAICSLETAPDVITFTSPSTVRGLLRLLGEAKRLEWLATAALACIGPVTERELIKNGYHAHIVAEEFSGNGLIECLIKWRETHGTQNAANTR